MNVADSPRVKLDRCTLLDNHLPDPGAELADDRPVVGRCLPIPATYSNSEPVQSRCDREDDPPVALGSGFEGHGAPVGKVAGELYSLGCRSVEPDLPSGEATGTDAEPRRVGSAR